MNEFNANSENNVQKESAATPATPFEEPELTAETEPQNEPQPQPEPVVGGNVYQPINPQYGGIPNTPQFDETYREKMSVRKLGNAVGFPVSMFIIASTVIILILQAVLLSIYGYIGTLEILNDPDMNYLISAGLSVFLLTVPYIFTVKMTNTKFRDLMPFKKISASLTVSLVMTGIGVCALSNYATSTFAMLLQEFFKIKVEGGMPDYGTDLKSFLLMLLCVGILPALLEEFALRGVVLGVLRKKFSDGAAVMISSILFALLHGNLQQIPFAFGVGLILGYATVYSGSMLPAIIIHGFNNSLQVVMSFATASMSPMVNTVISLLYFAVALLVGICGFIMLIKTDSKAFSLSKERSENTKKYFGWFCTSGWIIVFFALCALEVALAQGWIKISI